MRTGSFKHALVKGRRYAEASAVLAGGLASRSSPWARPGRRGGIVPAVERGERMLVLGVPAKALRLATRSSPARWWGSWRKLNRLLPSTPLDEQGTPDAAAGGALPARAGAIDPHRAGRAGGPRYNEDPRARGEGS